MSCQVTAPTKYVIGILIADGGISVEQGANAQGIAPIKEAETTEVLVRYPPSPC